MLRRAEVGEATADDGIVEPGMKVTYSFVGDDDVETFLLGAREIEDGDVLAVFPAVPAGSAIIGAKKGDDGQLRGAQRQDLEVKILDAVPYSG